MADDKKEEKKAEVKVSANLKKIIDEVEKLTVLELADLVKALEDKFGVSAAAPVAVAAPAAGAAAPAAEEKSEYQVVLTAAGANKIGVIKALREINQELGLKEAKKKLEAAGAQVELK